MSRRRTVLAVAVVLAAGAGGRRAHAGANPALKCAATKIQQAGTKAAAKLKCHAKAVGKGLAVDPLCLGKAEDKFDQAYTKVEDKGGCTTQGDAPAMEARVDTLVSQVVAALPGDATKEGRKCAGSKLNAAGKKAAAKLKCHAKAIGKGVAVDPTCLGNAEGKFASAFAKADDKGGYVTVDDAAALEALVDVFVNDVLAAIPSATSTTTVVAATSTTAGGSTTTTSTLPASAVCGNGVREGAEECDDGNDENTDACPTTCRNAFCGDGFTRTGVEQCDVVPPNPLVCQANCTWTPAVCGDGVRQFGETCDDGNTLDGDVCPADCNIAPCPPTATRVGISVSYAKQTAVTVGSLTLFLKYPDGTVGLPGLGNATSVRNRISGLPSNFGFTANDLDYALRMVISPSTVGAVLSPGLVFQASFDLCLNASLPSPAQFTCTVEQAATPAPSSMDIDLAANPMSCSLTIP
jgi:cysteine-rich repeat protein